MSPISVAALFGGWRSLIICALLVVSVTSIEAAPEGGGWRVESGEYLSLIARQLQPVQPLPHNALMRSLVELNPHAFVNGDPNRIRAGVLLQLPAPDRQLDTVDAVRQRAIKSDRVRREASELVQRKEPKSDRPGEPIGRVKFSRGAVTAQFREGDVRVVGQDSEIYEGDVLNVGKRSFATVNFNGGSQVTLRPRSIFKVEVFEASNQAAGSSSVMRLFRGGVRSISGAVGARRDAQAYLRTPMATIGIRGTEFDARICDADCASEMAASSHSPHRPVGRVAFVRGEVSAGGSGRAQRVLKGGAPVYARELIETASGSLVVVVFRDRSRVTLRPGTQFQVEEFSYQPGKEQQGNIAMRLLRGGLRSVSGFIGRTNRQHYRLHTPVATIGIRGTGYDVQCRGSCFSSAATAGDPAGQEGAFFSVFQPPGIDIIQGDVTTPVDVDQTFFIPNVGVAPTPVAAIPGDLINDGAPRPDEVEFDESILDQAERPADGLQLALYEGALDVETEGGDSVPLQPGEAIHVGIGGDSFEPVAQQRLLLEDPYYGAAGASMEFLNIFDLITGGPQTPGQPQECAL